MKGAANMSFMLHRKNLHIFVDIILISRVATVERDILS